MTPKTIVKTEETPVIASAEPKPEPRCAHHWIIEPPRQRISKGVCKLCGAEKEFENWAFEAQ